MVTICKISLENSHYIEYIASIIELNATLCKGRNKMAIKRLRNIGLTKEFIYYSL